MQSVWKNIQRGAATCHAQAEQPHEAVGAATQVLCLSLELVLWRISPTNYYQVSVQHAMWSDLCGQAFAEVPRGEMLFLDGKYFVAEKRNKCAMIM